jgi:hypothetical protein
MAEAGMEMVEVGMEMDLKILLFLLLRLSLNLTAVAQRGGENKVAVHRIAAGGGKNRNIMEGEKHSETKTPPMGRTGW